MSETEKRDLAEYLRRGGPSAEGAMAVERRRRCRDALKGRIECPSCGQVTTPTRFDLDGVPFCECGVQVFQDEDGFYV